MKRQSGLRHIVLEESGETHRKLGYGGTKEEMQRLIDDANEYGASIGEASDLSIESFSDIVTAIELIQEKQGIAGTTAKEAATTIEGSIAMTKAAWSNLLAEFGKDDGDVGERVKELVESAKTALLGSVDEKTGEVKGGIIPRVREIMSSIAEALPEAVPQIVEAGEAVFGSIAESIGIVMPAVLEAVLTAITDLANYISENADSIAEGAVEMFLGLADALAEIAPPVIQALLSLLGALVVQVVEHAPQMLEAAGELLLGLLGGIALAIKPAMEAMEEVVSGALKAVGDFISDMFNAGADLVQGLIDGIASMPGKVVDAIGGVIGDAIDEGKKMLGIASPSKVFREIGQFTMEGFAEGIAGGARGAVSAVESAMRAVAGVHAPQLSYAANTGATAALGASGNVYYVTIDGSVAATRQRVVDALDEIATAIEQEAVM